MMLSMVYGITGGMIDGYICTRGVFTKGLEFLLFMEDMLQFVNYFC